MTSGWTMGTQQPGMLSNGMSTTSGYLPGSSGDC
ncbi:hypothetical protein ACHAWF_000818 [Thalassiosira exigua]